MSTGVIAYSSVVLQRQREVENEKFRQEAWPVFF